MVEKTRDCQSDGFTAKRVSLKLQERQHPLQNHAGVRLYFDKRRRKFITNNINHETPYRCSLSQQNGLAATRGKTFMEPTFSARKRLREKEKERVEEQDNVMELSCKPSNSLLILPRISQGARPLVSIPMSSPKENKDLKDPKTGHFEGTPEIIRPKNAREYWEKKTRVLRKQKSDFVESQRSYEDIMRLREKHLVSCDLVKSTTPRSHQLALPQLRLQTTQRLKYFEYRKTSEEIFDDDYSSSEGEEQVVVSDFSRTLNDGSKIIASNHKLSIEVFMPKL
jgi:hypothetical protein